MRAIYRFWASLLFLAIVVQIGSAGYGAFNAADKADPGPLTDKQFGDGFGVHNGLGYVIFLASIILLLLALAARLGRRRVLLALVVPILVLVQIVLAWAGESSAAIGVLHPINAFVIAGLVGSLAFGEWMGGRRAVEPARQSPV